MLTRMHIIALAICFTLEQPGLAQGTAENVVRKAIHAAGYANDKKPYHRTWREKGKLYLSAGEMSYVTNWTYESVRKLRYEMEVELSDKKEVIYFIYNEGKAKNTIMGKDYMLQGEKLDEASHSAYCYWVLSLTPLVNEKGFTLKLADNNHFANKPVDSVVVSRLAQRDITLHFDKNTHLLSGSTERVKDELQGWKEVLQEAEFSDYEKLPSGEMIYKHLVYKRDGKLLMDAKLSNHRRTSDLKPELFKLD